MIPIIPILNFVEVAIFILAGTSLLVYGLWRLAKYFEYEDQKE